MSFLWESVKVTAQMAGNAAKVAGQKTKLKADVILVERELVARKREFGVELYDYVAPLASGNPEFFAANDKMTSVVRGPMLTAQREIAALLIRRTKLKEKLAQAEVARKSAFPTAAANIGEKVLNTGKAVGFAGNEAKIQTEISMVDTQITAFKQEFGLELFDVFVQLEDEEGWLPTIRDVRSMYDQARRDVEKLKAKKEAKEREIRALDGGTDPAESSRDGSPTPPPAWGGGPAAANGSSAYSAPAPAVQQQHHQPAIAPEAAAATGGYGSTGSAYSGQHKHAQPQPPTATGMFAYENSHEGAPSVPPATDPFSGTVNAAVAQQQQQPAAYDPFGLHQYSQQRSSQAQQQTYAPAPPAAYDPFSSTAAPPIIQQSAPYDPFTNSSTTQAPQQSPNNDDNDDPFAGL